MNAEKYQKLPWRLRLRLKQVWVGAESPNPRPIGWVYAEKKDCIRPERRRDVDLANPPQGW